MTHLNFMVNINITDAAENQISSFSEGQLLRVKISGGGCKGFQYEYIIEDIKNCNSNKEKEFYDIFFDGKEKNILVIDSLSVKFLKNATLDFNNNLLNGTFSIKNELSDSNCGCGSSFTLNPENL